jgi:activator of HSP90 ATPase
MTANKGSGFSVPASIRQPTRRQLITAGALAACAAAARPIGALAGVDGGISHTAESIHQEPSFAAGRKRVYEALTEAGLFDKVSRLSAAMQSAGMSQMKTPTQISPHVGGAFALFGGYIVGRHLELGPDELLVQAWRVGGWDRGIYSIARFELTEQGGATTIKFDHTGFPKGQAEHLAAGWQANYWDPLAKYLA